MELIRLSKEYKEQLRKVYNLVFEDAFGEEHCEFCLNHEDFWKQTYGWIDEERLVSTYTSIDIDVQFKKKSFKARYLDGVATLPSYRKQGLIDKMFFEDIERCKKEEIFIILLDPFKHSYYKRIGFEVSTESNSIEMDFDLLSKESKSCYYKVDMDYLKDSKKLQNDFKEINKWLWDNSPYNEMKQPPSYEETRYKHDNIHIAIVYDENSSPDGYLVYTEENRTLNIYSCRYKSLNAFYAMKKYISSYKDQVTKLKFSKVPEDFPIGLLVDDYWRINEKVTITKNLSRMMRIIDPKYVIGKLLDNHPKNKIYMKIKDELIEKNNGIYEISPNEEVEKIDKSNENKYKTDIEISIGDIVPLLTGRKSALELYYEGKLKVTDSDDIYHSVNHIPDIIKELDKMFCKTIAYNAELMMGM